MLPAIDRYDGPLYRVLRRYLRQDLTLSVDIRILSAEYGLIPANYPVPCYNHRLTKKRADKLRYQVITEIGAVLSTKSYKNFLICLGKDYLKAISGYETVIPDDVSVKIALGGMGRKLSILYDWLYGDLSSLEPNQTLASTKVRIRGIEVSLTSKEILDIARQAIAAKDPRETNYQSWYVPVDDQRVAPKWLVSQITGLPVSNFVTDDARRVLTRLGVEVKRV